MCGISGIYSHTININEYKNKLEKINNSLSHRGKDDEGYYFEKNIGLAHKRLAIIDLERGKQPMFSNCGRYVLIFNGEIYNYKDLKKELSGEYNFKTDSDSEVILAGYKKYSIELLNYLNGEWAFAIWDKKEQKLLLARDRFGIKPLFILKSENSLVFASEIKAIGKFRKLELNNEYLFDALLFGPIDGGNTIYNDVFLLKPGKYLEVDKKGRFENSYYLLENTFENKKKKIELDNVENLLLDSIKLRLESDVKIGFLNSGGLDSSLLTSMSKRFIKGIDSYNIFPESLTGEKMPGDESEYANITSEFVGTNHFNISYSENDFINQIDNSIEFNDLILYHSNGVVLDLLFNSIRKGSDIYVLIGGEGADEIFRGYGINYYFKLFNIFNRIPLINGLFKEYISKKNLRGKEIPYNIKYLDLFKQFAVMHNSHLSFSVIKKLINNEVYLTKERTELFNTMNQLKIDDAFSFYEQKCYMTDALHKVDIFGMKNSLEVRSPFLDHRIVELLNNLDFNYKVGFGKLGLKKILRKISKLYLPEIIFNRRKYGFATPIKNFRNNFQLKLKFSPDIGLDLDNMTFYDIYILYNYKLIRKSIND